MVLPLGKGGSAASGPNCRVAVVPRVGGRRLRHTASLSGHHSLHQEQSQAERADKLSQLWPVLVLGCMTPGKLRNRLDFKLRK